MKFGQVFKVKDITIWIAQNEQIALLIILLLLIGFNKILLGLIIFKGPV